MFKNRYLAFVLLLGMCVILPGCGGQVSTSVVITRLSWAAPVSRVNGDPLTEQDLKEYRLYYSTSADRLIDYISVGTVTSIEFADPLIQNLNLQPGTTYFFAVSCVDALDRESGLTDIKRVTFPSL